METRARQIAYCWFRHASDDHDCVGEVWLRGSFAYSNAIDLRGNGSCKADEAGEEDEDGGRVDAHFDRREGSKVRKRESQLFEMEAWVTRL